MRLFDVARRGEISHRILSAEPGMKIVTCDRVAVTMPESAIFVILPEAAPDPDVFPSWEYVRCMNTEGN